MALFKIRPAGNSNKIGWSWTGDTNLKIYNESINWPKISIVTPSFNQGQYIEKVKSHNKFIIASDINIHKE